MKALCVATVVMIALLSGCADSPSAETPVVFDDMPASFSSAFDAFADDEATFLADHVTQDVHVQFLCAQFFRGVVASDIELISGPNYRVTDEYGTEYLVTLSLDCAVITEFEVVLA
jgi:hypothetical protein